MGQSHLLLAEILYTTSLSFWFKLLVAWFAEHEKGKTGNQDNWTASEKHDIKFACRPSLNHRNKLHVVVFYILFVFHLHVNMNFRLAHKHRPPRSLLFSIFLTDSQSRVETWTARRGVFQSIEWLTYTVNGLLFTCFLFLISTISRPVDHNYLTLNMESIRSCEKLV